jgi:acyl carrier protein
MGNEQKLVAIVADVLKLDESLITDETSPSNAKNWDSFNMVQMAVKIEGAFNITITMNQLIGVTCYGDFKQLLVKHEISL